MGYHIQENLQEEGTEYTGYSMEQSSKSILDDHNEEKRITKVEKNECVQQPLMTLSSELSLARDQSKRTHNSTMRTRGRF